MPKQKPEIIQLDPYFTLEMGKHNFVLRTEKEVLNEKKGEMETHTDAWYAPKLSMIMEHYLNQSVKVSKNVEELHKNVLHVEKLIEAFL